VFHAFFYYDMAFKIKRLGALSVGDDRQFFKSSETGLSPPGCRSQSFS
jgi:hypothetical protein